MLSALVYLPAISHPFVFDDYDSIVEHPVVLGELPLVRALIDPPPGPTAARPLVCLTFVLNHALGGLEAWGYRLVNIAIHIGCGLLLFGVVRRTLERPAAGSRTAIVAGRLAAAVTLLWLLHPLQTEAVTYVTQRTELLMAMFLLATLYCAIRGVEANRGGAWYVTAVACSFAGMGCKEVMAVTPLVVLLHDRTCLAGGFRAALGQRKLLYLGLAASWCVVAYLIATSPRSREIGFDLGIGVLDNLYTQAGVITHYLSLAVWPHPLVITYDDWPVAQHLVQVWPFALLVCTLVAVTVWAVVRRPAFGFIGAWFFLILAPTSSFVPLATEIAAERRMYLPLAAVLLVVTVAVGRLIRWGAPREDVPHNRFPVLVTLFLLAASASTLATLARNRDYRSRMSIWQDAVLKRPASAYAHLNVGAMYLEEGRIDEAIKSLRRSLDLRPNFPATHFNLGNAYTRTGALEKGAEQYRLAVRAFPELWEARVNLATIYYRLRRLDDAAALYAELLQERPDNYMLRADFGTVLLKQGRPSEAEREYRKVLELNPEHQYTIRKLGDALLRQGRLDAAASQFETAIRLVPDQAESYYKLGGIRFQQGRIETAIALAQTAVRLDPQHTNARRLLQTALLRRTRDESQ